MKILTRILISASVISLLSITAFFIKIQYFTKTISTSELIVHLKLVGEKENKSDFIRLDIPENYLQLFEIEKDRSQKKEL